MALVEFHNASVELPIYNTTSRSLKKQVMNMATGGKLGKNPDGRITVNALSNLNITFNEGERIGLVGHNGAGKSTLLRMISGAYHPSSGSTYIKGKIGSLIDISLGIDPEATGRENIYIRGGLLGIPKKKLNSHLHEIIDFSELGDFIDMPVRTYSTGMHLRLAFSVSTLTNPDILLMDEWLSVGDENFQIKAEKRLNELINNSKLIVIASHSRELILKTCNRALWLEHGTIRLDSDPETVCNEYFNHST